MSMDRERVDRMRAAMAADRLDALVVRLPENITLLGGYYPLTGLNFLLVPREADPVLIVPESEADESRACWWPDVRTFPHCTLSADDPMAAVERLLTPPLRRAVGRGGRVGYEGSFESVAPSLLAGESSCVAAPTIALIGRAAGDAGLVDCSDLLLRERAVKTDAEVARMQVAARLADAGLAAFRRLTMPGTTGAEIAGQVAAAVLAAGRECGGRVQAFPQVSTGADETALAWRPCVISTGRIVREGDPAVLEMGVVADGLWADVTRTVVAGAPSSRLREMHDAVARAQRAAIAAAGEGVRCCDVDAAARGEITRAGLGDRFFHVTGHGIGFRYHEPAPLLHPNDESPLTRGMIFTVEPGVYVPGVGGVRIEDNIALTADGAGVLTTASRELTGDTP